jgi:hypothetical protein
LCLRQVPSLILILVVEECYLLFLNIYRFITCWIWMSAHAIKRWFWNDILEWSTYNIFFIVSLGDIFWASINHGKPNHLLWYDKIENGHILKSQLFRKTIAYCWSLLQIKWMDITNLLYYNGPIQTILGTPNNASPAERVQPLYTQKIAHRILTCFFSM